MKLYAQIDNENKILPLSEFDSDTTWATPTLKVKFKDGSKEQFDVFQLKTREERNKEI